ncbi:MAG: SDR family NAD(P)-dependent oxidoreductase [Rhodospirillales bacterium]|nr:SDR family NAD(P)-dependent oxidoreductase [Rhodospirillales bacterium]
MTGFDFDIAGKVALVTGASSGLGVRFARLLAGQGARVALAARRLDRLQALAGEIGGGAFALDVTDVAAVRQTVADIGSKLGPIAILVNNAGVSRAARTEDVTEADYDAVMATNLKGPFFMAQAVAGQMIASGIAGRIVNIASVAGLRPIGQLATYSMSKAALVMMTKAMARDWGRHGIGVHALCPGYIETEINHDWIASPAGEKLRAIQPRRRFGRPEDLDAALLLLCAGAPGGFLNGTVLAADDGFAVM